jgi:nucleotide-binding universal stress UspA family protein
MGKRILIAFDDSDNAMRAVEYVAQCLSRDNAVTLFSVLQDTAALCDMNSPELTPYFKSQQDAFCVLENKKKELLTAAQRKAHALLVANGFAEARLQVKSELKKKGVARDIAAEAQSGYDLVVIGRRGRSGLKEFFLGGISQKVLQLVHSTAILIVN